jgi:hypothetical protein
MVKGYKWVVCEYCKIVRLVANKRTGTSTVTVHYSIQRATNVELLL